MEGTKDVSRAQYRTNAQLSDPLLMVNPITKEIQQVQISQVASTVEAEVMVKVDEKVSTAVAGEKGSVNTKTVASTITVDGIYRASEAGDYKNLKAGLIAKVGWSTWFEKKGAVWSLYSEVDNNLTISNTGGTSTTTAITQKYATDTNNFAVETKRVADTMDCVISAKMDGGIANDFNTYRKRAVTLSIADRDKYLFPSLMNTEKGSLIGVRMTDGDTVKIPFKRASKDIGLVNGKLTLVGENIPIQVDYSKLTCVAPACENLGVNYNDVYLGGNSANNSIWNRSNIEFGENIESPINDGKALRLTNLNVGTPDGAFRWLVKPAENIEGRSFVASIYVKGIKGEKYGFNIRRNIGSTSNNRNILHTFSGDWERVQIGNLTGLPGQVGLYFGVIWLTGSTANNFLIWAPQCEEVSSPIAVSSNPIFYSQKSYYQLDDQSNPTESYPSLFTSEMYYPNSFSLDNTVSRIPGRKSSKFYFEKDMGEHRRSEIRGPIAPHNGMLYSHSVLFPESYAYDIGNSVSGDLFFQWRDTEDKDDFNARSPSLSIRTIKNNIVVRILADSRDPSPDNRPEIDETIILVENFERNVWHDFIYLPKWDHKGEYSHLYIWHRVNSNDNTDYKLVLNRVNLRMGYNDKRLPRHKWGLYRPDNFVGASIESRTIYHAEVKCWIDDGTVPLSKLYTGVYDEQALKLIRAEATIDSTGFEIIDPTQKKEYFWLQKNN